MNLVMFHKEKLKTTDLINIHKKVAPFMSNQESRYYLNGVCLDYTDGILIAIATDGHRLAKLTLPDAIIENTTGEKNFSFIIRKDLIKQLSTIKKKSYDEDLPVTIEINESERVTITHFNGSLIGQLVDGTFPEWRRTIPEEIEATIGFNAKYLMELARAAIHDRINTSNCVSLHIKDATTPMLVKEPDNKNIEYVLMPMRV